MLSPVASQPCRIQQAPASILDGLKLWPQFSVSIPGPEFVVAVDR